jgi:hypothetical protein
MVLAMSETWQQVLAIVLPILGTIVAALAPILIKWLQNQKWVQKLHLENFFGSMVPQVVQWVEYWAENMVKEGGEKAKPTSAQKMAKFKELLKKELPASTNMSDEQFAMRAEAELRKLKNGAGILAGDPPPDGG